jgi:hypothetical protein
MSSAAVSGLEPEEAGKVLDLLGMSGATLAAINSAFAQAFPADRHGSVVVFIRMLLDTPFGLADNPSAVPQTLIAYHLLRQAQLAATQSTMRRNPVTNLVRATQFHELQRLEGLLREDAKAAESHKYKMGGQANTPKKQTAKEAAELDIGRCRLLMKTLIFRHLLNRPDAESINELLSIPRAMLEAEADGWGSQAALKQQIGEVLIELKVAADAEANLSMGSAAARATLFPSDDQDSSIHPHTAAFRPIWARPTPTAVTISAAEFRFLCAPSISSSLLVDGTPYSADWRTASTLLTTARTQPLNASQHQQLVQAAAKSAGFINLTIQAFLEVSEHNPKTAAALVQTVAHPEVYIDALTALPNAAGCLRSEVLLAADPVLLPHQVSAYVKSMATYIRGQPKGQQADVVSDFAVTLHQLAKKHPLTKQDTDVVNPLFNEHASLPDVSSLWPQTTKA